MIIAKEIIKMFGKRFGEAAASHLKEGDTASPEAGARTNEALNRAVSIDDTKRTEANQDAETRFVWIGMPS